ncbi:MAG: HAMP domain-containing histidine kinase [Phycisphaerales bacterium]|nr:HAMP domain-containing histidine kinase [Phycisphaerales bacterium]
MARIGVDSPATMNDAARIMDAPFSSGAALRPLPAELPSIVQRLETEVENLHRLAMVGMMASMVAHEWNNLVTPVLARAEDALSRNDVDSMRHALERAIANIKKSVAVSKTMLSFAAPGEDELEPVGVAGAVREVLEAGIRPLDKDRIELRLDIGEDCLILAHRVLFEQLLLNLVLNARRAMSECGGFLTITARREGTLVEIDVRDTGVGITPEVLSTVVNPLLDGKGDEPSAWKSVGMGLTVCRTIAAQHSATISVRTNDDGRGCTFRLLWPAA